MIVDPATLLRLLQISDSSFPSGGFAFSNGLETLANEGSVGGSDDVERFIRDHLLPRWASFDRWYLVRAHEAAGDLDALGALDWLYDSQNSVESLAVASRRIGRATLTSHSRIGTASADAYLAKLNEGQVPAHQPIVQALVATALGLPREVMELSAVYQVMASALSAALRLGKVGSLQAQVIQTKLGPVVTELLAAPLPNQPHAFMPLADIAAMRHGDHETRLFAA